MSLFKNATTCQRTPRKSSDDEVSVIQRISIQKAQLLKPFRYLVMKPKLVVPQIKSQTQNTKTGLISPSISKPPPAASFAPRSRPTLPPIDYHDRPPTPPTLPIRSARTIGDIESDLASRPTTARSSSILTFLPGLTHDDPIPSLDQILRQINSSLPTDTRVKRLLMQSIFVLIRSLLDRQTNFPALFKASAICLKLDLNETEILAVLDQLSENHTNDHFFTISDLHQILCNLAFTNKPGVSRRAAGILRRICGSSEIANSLLQRGILAKFAEVFKSEGILPTPFVRLLIPLIGQIPNFDEFARSQILVLLLKLIGTYPADDELHHSVGNAIAQILDQADCPALFEQLDLTYFFKLFVSSVPEVIQSASIGLSTALEKSDRIVRALAGMPPPAGVAGLCAAMKCNSIACRLGLMNCLARLAEQAAGIAAIERSLGEIVGLIGLPIEDTGVWSVGQSFLLSGIVILQNAAVHNSNAVANALTGKIQPLLCPAVMDYTIDLVKMLSGNARGKELCNIVITAVKKL